MSLVSTSILAACTEGRVHVRGTVATNPTLVEIAPGVWVVEDYDRPVFYDDGYYWLYDDGYWFRSHTFSGSWLRVQTHYVPSGLRSLDRPRRYIHYRSRGDVRTRPAPRVRVRDHRRAQPRGRPDYRDGRRNERVPARPGVPPHASPRRAPPPSSSPRSTPRPAPRDSRPSPRSDGDRRSNPRRDHRGGGRPRPR